MTNPIMILRPVIATVLICVATLAGAQGTQVPFGGQRHDASQPVEINAEALRLDEANGTAVFSGDVRVGQGMLRIAADRIEVFYDETDGSGTVERMQAEGNVTLVNGPQAAEAEIAVYDVASGTIELQGDVLLTQGENALSSERLRIDLNTGTGELQGRVQTIFQPGTAP